MIIREASAGDAQEGFIPSYYVKVVFMNPSPGMCYTAGDAVDWYHFPTA